MIAESSWTLPSHVTLLSGLHPLKHGVRQPEHVPSADVELLAETLTTAGFYTFGITDGGWLSEEWGFARGFQSFHGEDQDFAETVREAQEYIRHRTGQGPWFGFLHTYDVHCPYDPPEPYFSMFSAEESEAIEVAGRCGNPHFNAEELAPEEISYLSDRYDGGVRWVDEALSELFRFFDEEGLWENTVVVVTSDHGEELGEHGQVGHEGTLYGEVLRVPMLVAAPGIDPDVSPTPVGLADVHDGVLELLGLKRGSFLVRVIDYTPLNVKPRYSDLAWKAELSSVWVPTAHLIFDPASENLHLFVLDNDPDEQEDLARERLAEALNLVQFHSSQIELLGRLPHTPGVHTGGVEALQGLGYGD